MVILITTNLISGPALGRNRTTSFKIWTAMVVHLILAKQVRHVRDKSTEALNNIRQVIIKLSDEIAIRSEELVAEEESYC